MPGVRTDEPSGYGHVSNKSYWMDTSPVWGVLLYYQLRSRFILFIRNMLNCNKVVVAVV